jgi:hypothetical protein
MRRENYLKIEKASSTIIYHPTFGVKKFEPPVRNRPPQKTLLFATSPTTVLGFLTKEQICKHMKITLNRLNTLLQASGIHPARRFGHKAIYNFDIEQQLQDFITQSREGRTTKAGPIKTYSESQIADLIMKDWIDHTGNNKHLPKRLAREKYEKEIGLAVGRLGIEPMRKKKKGHGYSEENKTRIIADVMASRPFPLKLPRPGQKI